ncbi:MAG: bifunctional hydroxymethylpyrimidine kinase/phosphomethylpyrimidine kinase [Hyphomicrobium sp.]
MPTPIALTIAGSDPSGGAGLQADLKTFAALGVYGASIVTALTAQNTLGVTGVMRVPAAFIAAQMQAVASDLKIGAAKTGMLGDAETVEAVAAAVRGHAVAPLIVDPVMVATSGDVLLAPDAIAALRTLLIPLAELITPNLPEAAQLLGEREASSVVAMDAQAGRLLALGCKAVLLKGGHGSGTDATDILATRDVHLRFTRPRIETRNTHGTGCTLSAAVTAFRAEGQSLAEAVAAAKDFVWRAIDAGRQLEIGSGSGPVDHRVGRGDRS